jgi:hypothetical protein
MLRTGAALLAVASSIVFGQTFAFEIGSPVASRDFRFKMATFVFRATGCSDPAKIEANATAEGIVGGARKSVSLKVLNSSNPGVFAVSQQWDSSGKWVVSVAGSCGGMKAGVLVPMGPKGFVREAARFFSQTPPAAEIEAALKAFPEGGYK